MIFIMVFDLIVDALILQLSITAPVLLTNTTQVKLNSIFKTENQKNISIFDSLECV
jgi:hypothetical protein